MLLSACCVPLFASITPVRVKLGPTGDVLEMSAEKRGHALQAREGGLDDAGTRHVCGSPG